MSVVQAMHEGSLAAAALPNWVLVLEGFAKGVIEAEGFQNIETCFKDGETVFQDAEKAFNDFKKKSLPGTIDGLKDTAAALDALAQGMKDCESI